MQTNLPHTQDRSPLWGKGLIVIGLSLATAAYSGAALVQLVSALPSAAACTSASGGPSTQPAAPSEPCTQHAASPIDPQETQTAWPVSGVTVP
jgi:hypothetical protein